ncbi:hypothetical protein N8T08_008260 [Aspergillus melleus]|uniref:Uncharacterized protein n=1 Tax=Aspergillus melleus TaxID=138277 RepID=A0ACC3AWJ0_9EURO|nr:hypothetical protein N8T08_008260 [Aspergillus melleus]
MSDESGDDVNDYVVIPRPGTPGKNNGEPPHVVQEIKTWLSPTDTTSPASEYRKHLNSHATGTGEWILETDQYRRWSETDTVGDLWIRGIPGSGKSVVAASMVRRLQRRGDAPVLFFFFREIIEANRTPQSLARDFCHGLLDHSPILQSMLEKLKSKNRGVQEVPFGGIWKCLSSALAAMPKVYCVVDALDEMESGHDHFLQDLLNLGRNSPKSIKLILTSRQVPHLEKHLGGSCLLDLRLDRRNVDRDIAIYITQRLESEVTLAEEEAGEIKKAICDRGKGLFLYARLVTDQLLLHPTTIVSQLNQLPDGLGSMYTNILRDHAARSQTTAEFQRLVLEYIVYSARPLRLLELSTIIDSLPDRGGLSADQPAKIAIRSTCGPLLEVCEDGVIQIIHHSLTEFLLNRDVSHIQQAAVDREFAVLDPEIAHENIARGCVKYVTVCCLRELNQFTAKTFPDSRALWQRYPFLQYAAKNWLYHAYMFKPTEDFLSFLDAFFNEPATFASWQRLCLYIRLTDLTDSTPLHVAAHSGLQDYVEHLLANGADTEALDDYNRTPLTHAAMEGYSEVAQTLLNHNARHDLVDDDMMTPIHYAAKLNHAEVAGCDVNATDHKGRSALFAWADFHNDNMNERTAAFISSLLENGADPCLENLDGGTPLHEIKRNRQLEECLKLFVQAGADIDVARKTDGMTPVHIAAQERSVVDSMIFSRLKADFNKQDLQGNTPLHYICQNWCRLWKHKDEETWVSLSDLNIKNYAGRAALSEFLMHVSSQGQHEDLSLFLKHGADLESRDHRGRTALLTLLSSLSTHQAKYIPDLLRLGADVKARDFQGKSVLHYAATSVEQVSILKMLIDAGADINSLDHDAATSDFNTRQLMDHGADIQAKTIRGQTALHYAAEAGQPNSVGLLLEAYVAQSLTVDDISVGGRTALHEAAKSGRYESVKLLLDAGSRVDIRDRHGRTPFHAVAEFDQLSIPRKRRRAYESTEAHAGKRPDDKIEKLESVGLVISSEEDSPSAREVVQVLLAAGADPAQRDNDKRTASETALLLGSFDVVDELAGLMTLKILSTDDSPGLIDSDPVGEALLTSSRESLSMILGTMSKSSDKQDVLKRVISTGNVRLTEELLCSFEVNLTEEDRTSALQFSLQWGLLSMARCLLPYIPNLHCILPSLLDTATERHLCNLEMVKLLIQSAVRLPCGETCINSREGCRKLDYSSALHRLATGKYWWYPRALAILLETGANTELLNKGKTPLQTALQAGRPDAYEICLWCDEAFDILLGCGADVNSSSAQGEMSPLQNALESKRDVSIVQRLLDHGASVKDKPVVASAITGQNPAALELLLKAGADPNVMYTTKEFYQANKPETPLKHAAGKSETLMEVLLAYGADPHHPLYDGTSSVLHEICALNARVTPIAKAGYGIETRDKNGQTPLLRACIFGEYHFRLARSPRNEESSAVELIRAGANVNAIDDLGSTALHYAICSGLDKVVMELLNHAASSTARNNHGLTPLHSALTGLTNLSEPPEEDYHIPSTQMVRQLLAKGADPLEPLPDGRTALHCIIPGLMQNSEEERPARKALGKQNETDVSFLDYKELYQTFVDAGCSREARDNEGNTPIFAYVRRIRCYHSDIESRIAPDLDDMRDIFTAHDIHAVNNAGDTLLHAVASREEDWEDLQDHDVMIFKLLVDLGLDPGTENKDGATPLDVADAWERDEILALFARDE